MTEDTRPIDRLFTAPPAYPLRLYDGFARYRLLARVLLAIAILPWASLIASYLVQRQGPAINDSLLLIAAFVLLGSVLTVFVLLMSGQAYVRAMDRASDLANDLARFEEALQRHPLVASHLSESGHRPSLIELYDRVLSEDAELRSSYLTLLAQFESKKDIAEIHWVGRP